MTDKTKDTPISNTPPKGTYDWMPEEFQIRKYIFDTWREVCTSFGYQEYLTPILEDAEIYRAKSGEDVGGKELMTMTDRAGRELAIRPEMTPSVTRMVTRYYESAPKPIRLFSIANFFRNEKPQRGRNREFWQLNYDIFGTDSFLADVEVLQIAIEIMLKLGAPEGSFNVQINNRKLIDAVLEKCLKIDPQDTQTATRIFDKFEKLQPDEFAKRLADEVELSEMQIEQVRGFLKSDTAQKLLEVFPELEADEGFSQTLQIIKTLNQMGYEKYIDLRPNIIRGFDYYDGMIFEVFDTSPDNPRALFGGGRYNGLAGLFGSQSFPAVGCAPGDETMRLFMDSWELLERVKDSDTSQKIYFPLLDEGIEVQVQEQIKKLRAEGFDVEAGLSIENLGKVMKLAANRGFDGIAIYGKREVEQGKEVEMRMFG